MGRIIMANPQRESKSGIFEYRVRVPSDVRALAKGKRVTLSLGTFETTVTCGDCVKVSLRTDQKPLAMQRFALVHEQLLKWYDTLRQNVRSLTFKEILYLAGKHRATLIRKHEDELCHPTHQACATDAYRILEYQAIA